MWCADLVRSQHAPLCIVPDFGQVTEDGVKIFAGNKSRDVFQERIAGSNEANGIPGGRPHIPVVSCSFALPCAGEGLARESCTDDINQARIACGVPVTEEDAQIAEYRGAVNMPLVHSSPQDALTVFYFFDIADCLPAEEPGGKQAAPCAGE